MGIPSSVTLPSISSSVIKRRAHSRPAQPSLLCPRPDAVDTPRPLGRGEPAAKKAQVAVDVLAAISAWACLAPCLIVSFLVRLDVAQYPLKCFQEFLRQHVPPFVHEK